MADMSAERIAEIEARLKRAESGGISTGAYFAYAQSDIPDLIAALRAERERAEKAEHSFKNFHRSLCQRFNYPHDEVDWQRDQVSLIESIAARIRIPETVAGEAIARAEAAEAEVERIKTTLLDPISVFANWQRGQIDCSGVIKRATEAAEAEVKRLERENGHAIALLETAGKMLRERQEIIAGLEARAALSKPQEDK